MINDLLPFKKIYFIGIGGIAMSACASLAKHAGYDVCGSDSKEIYPPASAVLKQQGIEYYKGYDWKNIKNSRADLFVLSAGENEQNPEVDYVVKNGLPRFSFPEMTTLLAGGKLKIVVAGTHGKSTSTGLLGYLLKNLDDSSFLVGGVLRNTDSNFHFGEGHYFVFEGDEYKSQFDDFTPKFHYYKPDILLLTNLEFDHPDMFANFEDLRSEFRLLLSKMPEDGLVIYNADSAELCKLVHESNLASVSFALDNPADFKIEKENSENQFNKFWVANKFIPKIEHSAGLLEEYQIQLSGKMNLSNALGVVALLRSLGFSANQFSLDLASFLGIKRRMEEIGKKNDIIIYDDYAHHPTAVLATLSTLRIKYPNRKIWAIFEPHTFSRTKAVLPDLAKSFLDADEVLISDIYSAREKAGQATITSKEVVEAIQNFISPVSSENKNATNNKDILVKPNIRLARGKQDVLSILKKEVSSGDIIIVMAVGNFNSLAGDLLKFL